MIFLLAGIVLISLPGLLWLYARWNYGTLEKLGIPVVKYTHPILGSTRALYENPGGPQDVEWMRNYGQIFGLYEGRTPTVYICVPELIRLICVKENDHFKGIRDFDFGDPILNESPDILPYDKWKIVRSLITPAFTTAKIKMMNLPMRQATQDFVSDIKTKIREGNGICEKFAIDECVHVMLTDLISRAFFSIQVDDRTNKNNAFAQIVADSLVPVTPSISQEITIYSHAFPFLKYIFKEPLLKPAAVDQFVKIFKQMMDERRRSGENRNDVVDMCLEWWDKLGSPEFRKVKISELTLLMQALIFFVAAQDQLSTMVAAVIFHMTQDPELETKIYEEVDEAFAKNNGKIEHEHLNQLTILNACIQECLRLYPVFHRTERMCTKDWHNQEYNLSLKKGTTVVIPIWALNRNGKYYERPDEFHYERFMPENKDRLNPFAFSSFGFGPRNCTGKRFATEAMPLILVYLLKKLKFKGRKDTEIKLLAGGMLNTAHGTIYVDVVERRK